MSYKDIRAAFSYAAAIADREKAEAFSVKADADAHPAATGL